MDQETEEFVRATTSQSSGALVLAIRIIGMVLAAIPLFAGYLPILTNDRRQGFHDKLARTVVRYRKPEHGLRRVSNI